MKVFNEYKVLNTMDLCSTSLRHAFPEEHERTDYTEYHTKWRNAMCFHAQLSIEALQLTHIVRVIAHAGTPLCFSRPVVISAP